MNRRAIRINEQAPLFACLLIVLLVLATAPASGAEFDLLVVQPPNTPCVIGVPTFPTIQDAVNASVLGDVIGVCPATYDEHVIVNKPGITLRAVGEAKLINSGGTAFDVVAVDDTIHGFDISGYDTCVKVDGVEGATIRANTIHGCTVGIWLNDATDSHVIANKVQGCTEGILVSSGADNEIGNNVVSDSADGGITVDGSPGINIHHNTSTGAGADGISVTNGSSDATVLSNNVRRNRVHGITISDSSAAVDKNIVIENGIPTGSSGISLDNASGCAVRQNTVASNGGEGIETTSSSCKFYLNNVYRNGLDGITVVDAQPGEKFMCNTSHFNNVQGQPGVFDCNWDGSDAPIFVKNKCATQTPDQAWSAPGVCTPDP